jgi:hypothetical protein
VPSLRHIETFGKGVARSVSGMTTSRCSGTISECVHNLEAAHGDAVIRHGLSPCASRVGAGGGTSTYLREYLGRLKWPQILPLP